MRPESAAPPAPARTRDSRAAPALPPPPPQPPAPRFERLLALSSQQFDVLVIGGGVTGCGIARDAALRGLRVALVEREDFASGT
ncbi:MAG: FAD-dependent oxidoreductase, partial [Archangium sp.]